MAAPLPPQQEATINGPQSRIWALEAKDCPEFAAHHIARLGIDTAHHPYRRVRLRPAGSFFLASLEGQGEIWLEGRWQEVTPGTVCLAPPRILNALAAVRGRRWVFAWVRYDEPPWAKPLVGASSPLRAKHGAEQFGRVIAGLREAWASEPDPAEIHHWVSLVQRLCLRSARPWQSGSRVGGLLESVARELHHDWKLSTLAARCHVSAEHLRRLCLRDLGRTPMEHVTYMRIQRAQELLEATDDKLEAVAAQVGYHSSDVFTRAFIRCVGMPPSHYRLRSLRGEGSA
jgi:AraC-like DNA-binding protein